MQCLNDNRTRELHICKAREVLNKLIQALQYLIVIS